MEETMSSASHSSSSAQIHTTRVHLRVVSPDDDEVQDHTMLPESGSTIGSATNPGVSQTNCGLRRPVGRALKRALDLLLALPIVFIVLPPLCAVVKFCHLLQSRGPLFYRQLRRGRDGVEFSIVKFRTMNVPEPGESDIDANPGRRIFPLGTLLRRSKIDELPQFLNVLAGTMSVVGPRPHHNEDCESFSRRVQDYTLRSIAKPGITGLAQYSEYRGEFEWNCVESRVARDLDYINQWSLLFDIRLIAKTVSIVSFRIVEGVFRRLGWSGGADTAPKAGLSIYSPEDAVPDAASAESSERNSKAA